METLATFRLWGDDSDLTAAAVTQRLGIKPSEAFETGSLIRSTERRREVSRWSLASKSSIEVGAEVSTQVDRVLTILEPATAALWQLAHEGRRADWSCYVASNPAEHAVELDRHLLARLPALLGDVLIDACGDGTERLRSVPVVAPRRAG